MNQEELKERVAGAVQKGWPEFRREHPALAQVIDQTMLSEHVVESLSSDPQFRQAYDAAVEARVGAQVFSEMVGRFVAATLERLR